MFNPFDLAGPEFLGFFFVLGIVVYLGVRFGIASVASAGAAPKLNLTDPYQIALLRGGETEAIRVAAASLYDRGLLQNINGKLAAVKIDAAEFARRPLERAILRNLQTPGFGYKLSEDAAIRQSCAENRLALAKLGLFHGEKQKLSLQSWVTFGAGVLAVTAGIKVMLAFQRGHTNIIFLLLEGGFFLYVVMNMEIPSRTALGDRVLADLRQLFGRLKSQAAFIKAGGQTNELALLVAVFGLEAVSEKKFPSLKPMFTAPRSSGGRDGDAWNATSVSSSSSCSTSCGSSCGGGGCGGGCGGCGS